LIVFKTIVKILLSDFTNSLIASPILIASSRMANASGSNDNGSFTTQLISLISHLPF